MTYYYVKYFERSFKSPIASDVKPNSENNLVYSGSGLLENSAHWLRRCIILIGWTVEWLDGMPY